MFSGPLWISSACVTVLECCLAFTLSMGACHFLGRPSGLPLLCVVVRMGRRERRSLSLTRCWLVSSLRAQGDQFSLYAQYVKHRHKLENGLAALGPPTKVTFAPTLMRRRGARNTQNIPTSKSLRERKLSWMCPGTSATNNLPELLRVGQALAWEPREPAFLSQGTLGKTLDFLSASVSTSGKRVQYTLCLTHRVL